MGVGDGDLEGNGVGVIVGVLVTVGDDVIVGNVVMEGINATVEAGVGLDAVVADGTGVLNGVLVNVAVRVGVGEGDGVGDGDGDGDGVGGSPSTMKLPVTFQDEPTNI